MRKNISVTSGVPGLMPCKKRFQNDPVCLYKIHQPRSPVHRRHVFKIFCRDVDIDNSQPCANRPHIQLLVKNKTVAEMHEGCYCQQTDTVGLVPGRKVPDACRRARLNARFHTRQSSRRRSTPCDELGCESCGRFCPWRLLLESNLPCEL